MNYSNNLDPNQTPFLNRWKSTTLAKAKAYGIPLEPTVDFKSISNRINEYERVDMSITRNTTANNDNFIGAYERELIAKAIDYQISFNHDYSNYSPTDWIKLIDAIEEFKILIEQAREFDIKFDLYKDDIIGLEQALEEAKESENRHVKGLCSYYNSTRI